MSDDKPRIQWSATEIVGIGIDNPERVRKTEDGKTVLMPTTFTIKSSPKVTKEDLLNDDPIFPFTTRPSDVAEEIMKIEDERVLKALLSATQPIDSSFKQGQDLRLEVERKMLTALGVSKDFLEGPTTYSTMRFQFWEGKGAYSVPVKFAEEVAAATVQTAAAVLSAAGGEE